MHISSILPLMQTFYNTSSEYKKMNNKTISWNDNWILIFCLFHGKTPWSFYFIISNDKMDKRFIKNWVLHIPHHLRDLLWIVRAWSSVAPIFSSLTMSRACFSSSQSLLKVITSFWHTFLAWMNPMILGLHSRWISPLLHSWLLLLLQVVLWFERPS